MKATENGYELELGDFLTHGGSIYKVVRLTKTLAICESYDARDLRVSRLSTQKNMESQQIFHLRGEWGWLIYKAELNK